jgi:small GTP-binding protein
MQSDERLFKLVLCGSSAAGKTALMHRVADDFFYSPGTRTLGGDFKTWDSEIEGMKAKLQIWDTAGGDRFRSITASYIRKADTMILVCDVTNPETLEQCRIDFAEFYEQRPESLDRPIPALIVTKMDLPDDQGVLSQAREFAGSKGMACFPVSAATGQTVREAFTAIAASGLQFYAIKSISCLVVGDRRAGKKNLVWRLLSREFCETYAGAPGQSLHRGTRDVDGVTVRILASVFSGPEGMAALAKYDNHAGSILCVHDVNNPESFEHLQRWMSAVRGPVRRSTGPTPRVLVVGNKTDLISTAGVVPVAKQARRRGNVQFIDASAKRGDNVQVLFDAIFAPPTDSSARARSK